MKIIVCVCGKSGSGKTLLAQKIHDNIQESVYINLDEIAHNVLLDEEIIQKMQNYFGKIILNNGVIDRKILGQIVFHDSSKMAYLKEITWPLMEKMVDKIILNNADKVIILDYLLLPETKYFTRESLKIYLDIALDIRKKRIIKRDGISEDEFLLRDNASPNYDTKLFDIILDDKSLQKIIEE